MPELPEVETIARGLAERYPGEVLVGARVKHADVLAPPLGPTSLGRRLAGRRVERVGRYGKNVLVEMDGALRMLINLGMTGRLVPADSPRASELGHVAVRFRFRGTADLLYDDVRRFGRIELHDEGGWAERIASIGYDPFDPALDAAQMHAMTRASRVPIRNWLLDQRRIAGVGNIYASEALFRARVHPARRARTLVREEAAALLEELRAVLREAIEARGTTFSDYVDAAGETGGFQVRLQAYDRAGEPCVRCGEPMRRLVLSNRSAFYCPVCQPRRRGRRAVGPSR